MWDKDRRWANAVGKMVLLDLLSAGLPQTFDLYRRQCLWWRSTILQKPWKKKRGAATSWFCPARSVACLFSPLFLAVLTGLVDEVVSMTSSCPGPGWLRLLTPGQTSWLSGMRVRTSARRCCHCPVPADYLLGASEGSPRESAFIILKLNKISTLWRQSAQLSPTYFLRD